MSIFFETISSEDWVKEKRKKLLNLFLEHEYGFCPLINEKLNYNIVSEKNVDDLICKKIEMTYKTHKMYFGIFYANNFRKPLKTFLTVVHPYAERNGDFFDDYKNIEHFCPIKDITNKGFAVVLLSAKTVADDVIDGNKTGIFKVCEDDYKDSSWGVLAAWAWGCSKVLDYLVLCPEIDGGKVAIIGHSRGGKTALLAGAIDQRFYLSISNNSGNSGAALSRGNTGETIYDITSRFPYWFCKKYSSYANNENSLPFDQHMLIALQAPRYCYIASASEDWWADPYGELLAAKLASNYYKIYNLNGLIVPEKIELDVSYNDGHIAYHRRTGNHGLSHFDWEQYMTYFEKISK